MSKDHQVSTALLSLNEVTKACFGQTLAPNFQDSIEKFKKCWTDLALKPTPKAHVLFSHVPQFIQKFNEPLGKYSEQPIETCHQDFKEFWIRGKYVRGFAHDDYPKQLLRAVTLQ